MWIYGTEHQREWKPGDPHARWSDPHEPSGTHSDDPDQNWKLVRGIISSKPIHFMTEAERASQSLSIETLSVDIGAVSRKEVTEVFGISIGDPAVPEVSFSYDEERDLCFGKAF